METLTPTLRNISSGTVTAKRDGHTVVVTFDNVVLASSVSARGTLDILGGLPKAVMKAHGFMYGLRANEAHAYALIVENNGDYVAFKALNNAYSSGNQLRGSVTYMCE